MIGKCIKHFATRVAAMVLVVRSVSSGDGTDMIHQPLSPPAPPPRLHVVTFMNKMDRKFAYLQVSAEAHGLHPQVLGYGMEAWWPDGLGAKINALRDFTYANVDDNDVILFADAFDVLVYGDGSEILSRFATLESQLNCSLLLNAEEYCFPKREGVCDEATYPASPHKRWRFLNSGLIIGRGRAVKALLHDPVPNVIKGSDQFWYQHNFRLQALAAGARTMQLDYGCFLLCAVTGDSKEQGVALQDGRIKILETDTQPSLVHFVSVAHWNTWREGSPTTALHEVFKRTFPGPASRLLDGWKIEGDLGVTHTMVFYEGAAWWGSMRSVLCIQCRFLGSSQNECIYFPSAFESQCIAPTILFLVGLPLLLVTLYRCMSRSREHPDSRSQNVWRCSGLLRPLTVWMEARSFPWSNRSRRRKTADLEV